MSRCEDIAHLLGAYYDGYLPRDERARVEEHLSGCETCMRDVARIAELDALARRLPLPDPGAEYWDELPLRVRTAIERPEPVIEPWHARLRRWITVPGAGLRLAGAFTTVLLAVVIGLYVSEMEERTAGVLTLEDAQLGQDQTVVTSAVEDRSGAPAEGGGRDVREVPAPATGAPHVALGETDVDRTRAARDEASGGFVVGTAEPAARREAEAGPADDSALFEEAQQYQSRGYLDRAIESYDALMDEAPASPYAAEAAYERNVIAQMKSAPFPDSLREVNREWEQYIAQYPGARDEEARYQLFQNTLALAKNTSSWDDLIRAREIARGLARAADPAIRDGVQRGLTEVDSILAAQAH